MSGIYGEKKKQKTAENYKYRYFVTIAVFTGLLKKNIKKTTSTPNGEIRETPWI